jgi:hypothetical protein
MERYQRRKCTEQKTKGRETVGAIYKSLAF